MSDDRVKLPWETDAGAEQVLRPEDRANAPSAPEDDTPPEAQLPPNPPTTASHAQETAAVVIDPGGGSGFSTNAAAAAATANDQPAPAPVAETEPRPDLATAEHNPAASVAWSTGAVEGSERSSKRSSGAGRISDRIRTYLGVDTLPDGTTDEWIDGEQREESTDVWLQDLRRPGHATESSPEFAGYVPSATPIVPMEHAPELGEEGATAILEGPRVSVAVPRVSAARLGVVGVAAIAVTLVVVAYGLIYPAVRGGSYRSELGSAYSNTAELREELPGILQGQIPEDLTTAGKRYRGMADTYAPYSKVVFAPPPAKPLLSFSRSLDNALDARSALLALNEKLGPAVDQVRARGGYFDTLAAISEQMLLAESLLGSETGDSDEGVLIVEGTVANATSLNAITAAQRAPDGYEEINRLVNAHLADYVRVGREYLLAVKMADSRADALKADLLQSAKRFAPILSERASPAMDPAALAALSRLEQEAEEALS